MPPINSVKPLDHIWYKKKHKTKINFPRNVLYFQNVTGKINIVVNKKLPKTSIVYNIIQTVQLEKANLFGGKGEIRGG